MKIKWRVDPAPTGKWRSFTKRGWPMAETTDKGEPVFRLDCADVPRLVREGKHAEIEILVRCGRQALDGLGWQWKRLVKRAATLDEAKAIVARFIEQNPNHDYGL